ncbi:hypothetical protein ABIA35_003096 [Catenulispora sp. MAP12-49]
MVRELLTTTRFSLDDFAIDATAGTVTCPAGHQIVLGEASRIHLQRRAAFTECAG